MRVVRYHEYGGPDVLQVDDVEEPSARRGEVVVNVRAASVNPIDAILREGTRSVPLPMITGGDFAGTVQSIGDGVTRVDLGDRVFGCGIHPGFTQQGTMAEMLRVPESLLATLPDNVPFDEAAAAATVGVTAWRGLISHAELSPGQNCLIHGGNGGVGHIAVQLASTSGATVFATGRSEMEDQIKSFGAEKVFDYEDDNLPESITKASDGGVDVVLDHMLHKYHQTDVDVAAFDGEIVVIGGKSGTLNNAGAARGKEITVHHMSMANLATEDAVPTMAPILRQIAELLKTNKITPFISRTYDLEEAPEAQRAVMEDSFIGKLIIEP